MAQKHPCVPDDSTPVTVHADCGEARRILDKMKSSNIEKADRHAKKLGCQKWVSTSFKLLQPELLVEKKFGLFTLASPGLHSSHNGDYPAFIVQQPHFKRCPYGTAVIHFYMSFLQAQTECPVRIFRSV